jgi:hypothetical protein
MGQSAKDGNLKQSTKESPYDQKHATSGNQVVFKIQGAYIGRTGNSIYQQFPRKTGLSDSTLLPSDGL